MTHTQARPRPCPCTLHLHLVSSVLVHHLTSPCTLTHTPFPTVNTHPQAYATSVSVYLPFYLVSSVLVHRQALLQRPGELLPKLLAAVLRSSAFLSLYIAAAFGGESLSAVARGSVC